MISNQYLTMYFRKLQGFFISRDHNATSYSTETFMSTKFYQAIVLAEIITLRAIALKRDLSRIVAIFSIAEIITLRAIALKLRGWTMCILTFRAEIITLRAIALKRGKSGNSHDARNAEIITLRAIALKQSLTYDDRHSFPRRDHNATSYSTETQTEHFSN